MVWVSKKLNKYFTGKSRLLDHVLGMKDTFKYHGTTVESQETEETTRPVENVALTTKGLQERKYNL